jgi:hypothetical protein
MTFKTEIPFFLAVFGFDPSSSGAALFDTGAYLNFSILPRSNISVLLLLKPY